MLKGKKIAFLVVVMLVVSMLMSVTAFAATDTSFYSKAYVGNRNDFDGEVGYVFVPAKDFTITALGYTAEGMTTEKTLTIWKSDDKSVVAQITVSADAATKDGFKYAELASPVVLTKGVNYRLSSNSVNGGDKFFDLTDVPDHSNVAAVIGDCWAVGAGNFPDGFSFTDTTDKGFGSMNFWYADDSASAEANPKTGDSTELLTYALVVVLSIGCAFVAFRRLRTSN